VHVELEGDQCNTARKVEKYCKQLTDHLVVHYLTERFFLRCSKGTSQENGQCQHEEETKHFALVPTEVLTGNIERIMYGQKLIRG